MCGPMLPLVVSCNVNCDDVEIDLAMHTANSVIYNNNTSVVVSHHVNWVAYLLDAKSHFKVSRWIALHQHPL